MFKRRRIASISCFFSDCFVRVFCWVGFLDVFRRPEKEKKEKEKEEIVVPVEEDKEKEAEKPDEKTPDVRIDWSIVKVAQKAAVVIHTVLSNTYPLICCICHLSDRIKCLSLETLQTAIRPCLKRDPLYLSCIGPYQVFVFRNTSDSHQTLPYERSAIFVMYRTVSSVCV